MIPRLLQISLVPKTTWYRNVRSSVSRDVWNEIRRRFAKKQCQICGFRHNLQCHEVWGYDAVNHVQKLRGFLSLCMLCHFVEHLGLAGIMAQRGDLDYQRLIRHYCDVNECTEAAFLADRKEAFELFQERSRYEWTLDLSYLDSLGLGEECKGLRDYMRAHPDAVEGVKRKHGL